MGELIWVDLCIGGALSEKYIPDLAKLLADDFGFPKVEAELRSVDLNDYFKISDEITWGDISKTVAFLKEHNLPFYVYNGSYAASEPTMEWWFPGMEEEAGASTTDSGFPLMEYPGEKLKEGVRDILIEEDDKDTMLERIHQLIDTLNKTNVPDLPPFIIT